MVHPGDQRRQVQRIMIEFDTVGDGQRVSGVAHRYDDSDPQPFTGWLDLMRLLEAASDRPLERPRTPNEEDLP